MHWLRQSFASCRAAVEFGRGARRASADDASVQPARFPRLRQLRIEDSLFFNVGYLVCLAASSARNNTRRWAATDSARG